MTIDPVSIACEAIQTSLTGSGVPAFLRIFFKWPNISAVSSVALRMLTLGFLKKVCNNSLFCRSLFPPLNPAWSSPMTKMEKMWYLLLQECSVRLCHQQDRTCRRWYRVQFYSFQILRINVVEWCCIPVELSTFFFTPHTAEICKFIFVRILICNANP